MALGSYLKRVREQKSLSLRDVERLCKISSGHLSMIEHNKVKEPTPRILHSLARIYDVSYIGLMKQAGYLPDETPQRQPSATFAFKGAERLSDDQRKSIQRLIELELLDAQRQRRKNAYAHSIL